MKFKKLLPILLIAISALLLLSFIFIEYFQAPSASKIVRTGGIKFELVETQAAQERGLSGRTNIPPDYGMLFVFPKDDTYGIWMKDMKEPIDILWLSESGEVLQVKESVSPDTYPSIFYPPVPVRYVLEMHSGEAVRKGFILGSKVPLPLLK